VRPDRLQQAFHSEAARHLDAARDLLAGGEPLTTEQLAELFRRLHSVKGMAVSAGHEAVAERAHQLEERVARVRRRGKGLSATARRELLRGVDGVRERVERPVPAEETATTVVEGLPPVQLPEDRLDRLFDVALGLSAAQQRLEHRLGLPADGELLALRDGIQAGIAELRREILELRLLPVRSLLPLLEGAVRRWSQECGVRVQVSVRGDGVRADRRMLERLIDPLGHLLRNALVHGIEPPAERRRAGKPEAGTIRLTIRREHDRLMLRVTDDGRGVDPREVLHRAVERGVIAAGSEASLPRDAALDLLTRDGMSRLSAADGLAGRGVGLGAARGEIERLGGTLRLHQRTDSGLTVEIRLPLGLAVLDVFLVETRGQTFAIPVGAVREVHGLDQPEGPRGPPPERSLDLGEALGLGPPGPGPPPRALLVVEGAGPAAVLATERVRARAEVVVRPLGSPLEAVAPWSGAALLPWGGLALVLDPLRLAPRARAVEPATSSARMEE
jgi:chemotaxis protein histidine kinase CheA